MKCGAVEHLFSVCLSERRSADSCRHFHEAYQRCTQMLDRMERVLMTEEDKRHKGKQ